MPSTACRNLARGMQGAHSCRGTIQNSTQLSPQHVDPPQSVAILRSQRQRRQHVSRSWQNSVLDFDTFKLSGRLRSGCGRMPTASASQACRPTKISARRFPASSRRRSRSRPAQNRWERCSEQMLPLNGGFMQADLLAASRQNDPNGRTVLRPYCYSCRNSCQTTAGRRKGC